MLIDQLNQDLKAAMFAHDEKVVSTLRYLLSALRNEEIALRSRSGGTADQVLGDEAVISIISRQVKQHHESIESFKTGNRPDLVIKEEEELAILKKYLPEQMSDEELIKLVSEAITSTGAVNQADFGKVMGFLMPKVKGKVDGGRAAQLVKVRLQ